MVPTRSLVDPLVSCTGPESLCIPVYASGSIESPMPSPVPVQVHGGLLQSPMPSPGTGASARRPAPISKAVARYRCKCMAACSNQQGRRPVPVQVHGGLLQSPMPSPGTGASARRPAPISKAVARYRCKCTALIQFLRSNEILLLVNKNSFHHFSSLFITTLYLS